MWRELKLDRARWYQLEHAERTWTDLKVTLKSKLKLELVGAG